MKNLFKLLLVLAIFICLPTNAFSPGEDLKPPIIENSMADSFIVNTLQTNFVYLSMEKENSIKFENGSVIQFVSSDADNAGKGNTPFKDYFDESTKFTDDYLDELKKIDPEYYKAQILNKKTEIFTTQNFVDKGNWLLDFTKEFNKKKEVLLEARIRKYLPDFNIKDLSKENIDQFCNRSNFNQFYQTIEGNKTHYFLKRDNHSDVRLITFIRKENPLEISNSPDNYSASISVEESYY